MKCKKCGIDKEEVDFYLNDKTCKECRKARVRQNRKDNIDHYREYDRKRANRPDRVESRKAYAKTDKGVLAANRAKLNWTLANAKKRWCANSVNNAIRDGKIKKPNNCESCGLKGRIEGHHSDYDKPLEVTWLCSQCHRNWHKINGEGKNSK